MQKHLFLFIGYLIFILPSSGIAQSDLYFEHLDLEDGLSDNRVNCVFQDSKGFIWFGTEVGLTRFDGLTMKVFYEDPDQPELNYPQTIYEIVEDEDETMWMRGLRAVYHYNPKKETFEAYQIDENQKGLYNILHEVYLDRHRNVWVGTLQHGLMRFERDSSKFLPFPNEFGVDLPSDFLVDKIIEDSFDNLWFNHPNGLYRFSWADSSLYSYTFQGSPGEKIGFSVVNTFMENNRRQLWVGTDAGLYQYDRKKDNFIYQPLDPFHPESKHEITVIEESAEENLWIIVPRAGLYILDTETLDIPDSPLNLAYPMNAGNNTQCISLHCDHSGSMWLGTMDKGVYYWNSNRKPFIARSFGQGYSINDDPRRIITHQERTEGEIWISKTGELAVLDTESFPSFQDFNPLNGQMIIRDQTSKIWIGSWGHGLTKIDPFNKEITVYQESSNQPGGLPGNIPNKLFEDKKGNIWIGVWLHGLYRYDPQNDSFIAYPMIHPQTQERMNLAITGLYEDQQENLWLGTFTQLIKLRPDRTLDTIFDIPECFQFQEDLQGNLMIATGRGLCQLDTEKSTYRFWRKKNGLPHDRLYSILMDDKGVFWLGTHKGLSRFDPDTEIFRNFDTADGIPGNEFYQSASLKNQDGTFYFGFNKGLLQFHPNRIDSNPNIPPVVITHFQIQNQAVPIRNSKSDTLDFPSPLEHQITYTEKIRLNWRQNDISFEFRALDFLHPDKIQYQYFLENYDPNWISTNAQRPYANYTNLNPGKYIFRVKAANGDGIWNEEGTSLQLIITPPWWKTWWAYSLYASITVILLFSLYRFQLTRKLEQAEARRAKEVQQKNEQLEEAMDHLQTTQQQLIMQEKMASLGQMTAGIAHEIKNPLNFVNNLAELSVEMTDELKEELERYQNSKDPEDYEGVLEVLGSLQKNAAFIQENGQRADGIISSMMDHANNNRGERVRTDLNALVDEYVKLAYHGYKSNTEKGKIIIQKELAAELPEIVINPRDIGRVLINLINNACDAVEEKANRER